MLTGEFYFSDMSEIYKPVNNSLKFNLLVYL